MGLFWMVDGAIQKDRPIVVPQSRPPTLQRESQVAPERQVVGQHADPSEQVRVTQVMTRDLVTLTVEHTVEDAFDLCEDFGFNHVPVVDAEGRLAGIVSDRDLYRCMNHLKEPLGRHMTCRVVVSRPSTFLKDAARVLMTEKFSSLPVINTENEPVGLVTMADILGYLVRHPAMELWS